MLLHNVFTKTLRDLRWPTFWVGISLAALGAYFVALYPEYAKVLDIQGLMEKIPAGFRDLLVGSEFDATNATGFLNIELFPLILPALLTAFAVTMGSGFTAAEESRGTIDVLLSFPIARWRVVLDKCSALLVSVAVIAVVMLLGIQAGSVISNSPVEAGNIAAALFLAALLALDFGGLALLLAAWSGNRAVAAALPVALLVIMYLVQSLSGVIDLFKSINGLSLFHYYLGHSPMKHGLDFGDAAVLAVVALVLAGASLVAFERRDLAA